jgi:hypothetical protein
MKMCGEWRHSSTILELSTRWRWVVSFTCQLLYPRGKIPRCPLDRRLGGPQNCSECCGEEKNVIPWSELNPNCPARSLSLYWLLFQDLLLVEYCLPYFLNSSTWIADQYIPIQPSTQQLFINIWGTTCFDPNGPSSGVARLTHSITELQRAYSHLRTYGSNKLLSMYIQVQEPDIDSNKNHTCD